MASYAEYLSNLDALVFDSPNETVQTDKDISDELDLWGNAQFTFDVKPGVGIYDEEKSKNSSPSSTPKSQYDTSLNDSGLDPATYESLVNYLDYELPSRPEVKLEKKEVKKTVKKQQPRIQPRPLAPALPALIAPAPVAVPVMTTRQVLMPKPATINTTAINPTDLLSSLLTKNISTNNAAVAAAVAAAIDSKKGLKRAASEDACSDDGLNPDEDKRRRNTAASARFRIKKKMREQAMEQSVQQMNMKSEKLQQKVDTLEMEIKFLRSLLLNKAALK